MVIDGKTLNAILQGKLEEKFLELTQYCRSVLCCRSTPLQKSMIVKLVRDKLRVMTLAIGTRHADMWVAVWQEAWTGGGVGGGGVDEHQSQDVWQGRSEKRPGLEAGGGEGAGIKVKMLRLRVIVTEGKSSK